MCSRISNNKVLCADAVLHVEMLCVNLYKDPSVQNFVVRKSCGSARKVYIFLTVSQGKDEYEEELCSSTKEEE